MAIGAVGCDIPVDFGLPVGCLAGLELVPQGLDGGQELLGLGRTSLVLVVVVVACLPVLDVDLAEMGQMS